MNRPGPLVLLSLVVLSGTIPQVQAQDADKAASERFETLLKAARETPEKADWKEVRQAFTRTSLYTPYSTDVTDKLKTLLATIRGGDLQGPEAELITLIEQERFMRINAMIVLVNLYTKRGEPEKATKYRAIIDGIITTMVFPDAGTSYEKAIEVLYIPEEYFIASGAKVAKQGVQSHEGHRYDVLTLAPTADKPERELFFNIDLMWAANPISKQK